LNNMKSESKREREGEGDIIYIYVHILYIIIYIYTVESSIIIIPFFSWIHLLALLQAPRNLSRTSSPSRGGASSPSRGRTLSPRGGATSSGTLQRQGHGRGAWVERVRMPAKHARFILPNHHCLCNSQRCPCFIPT
jgi:hypothetical protein